MCVLVEQVLVTLQEENSRLRSMVDSLESEIDRFRAAVTHRRPCPNDNNSLATPTPTTTTTNITTTATTPTLAPDLLTPRNTPPPPHSKDFLTTPSYQFLSFGQLAAEEEAGAVCHSHHHQPVDNDLSRRQQISPVVDNFSFSRPTPAPSPSSSSPSSGALAAAAAAPAPILNPASALGHSFSFPTTVPATNAGPAAPTAQALAPAASFALTPIPILAPTAPDVPNTGVPAPVSAAFSGKPAVLFEQRFFPHRHHQHSDLNANATTSATTTTTAASALNANVTNNNNDANANANAGVAAFGACQNENNNMNNNNNNTHCGEDEGEKMKKF